MPRFVAVYTMKPEGVAAFRARPKSEQEAIDKVGLKAWEEWGKRNAATIVANEFYVPSVPGALGVARYMLKEHSVALPPLREFASRAPNLSQGHIWLAANLAQLGRLDEARAEAAEVLRIDPKFAIDDTLRRLAAFKRPEDAEHLFDGLRKAGLPEK
jgi:tetratricopeptide (TPR) repeat protein